MTRVRYKNVNGVLVSNEILMGTNLVRVELNPETLYYNIADAKTTYYNGNASNLQSLKRSAKQALKELGVNFKDEIRAKHKKLELHENQG
jgi:hypothetical protein